MDERWYIVKELPDLTLNKYSSLDESGVSGVLEKHIAFLRQINRAGIVSGLSFHLFYLYIKPHDEAKDAPGRRLNIFLLIRGKEESMSNVYALMKASPLSEFFFQNITEKKDEEKDEKEPNDGRVPRIIREMRKAGENSELRFNTCCVLTKTETLLPAEIDGGSDYYMLREWEMNDEGRLYGMCKMMEALGKTALYRVDLYPVERSKQLRDALRKPMAVLRKRQDERSMNAKRDYNGKDVLDSYEDLIEKFDSSPHFISNIMVFANSREDAASILDAGGAESLMKGKYSISTFASLEPAFSPDSFLSGEIEPLKDFRERTEMKKGSPGLIVCREDTSGINLNYLPTLFSLEEITPFFRFPALYDGETIQLPKETAPEMIAREGSLYLGKDRNNYDVNFPLKLFPKHAFISGVPGSGKTNAMHHITSSLWKEHGIPFLVLEPAKQEYRALLNDPEMRGIYLFSPNADMSFPLHINPFEMPKGTLISEHIRLLCTVFEGAFPLTPPMPFLLDTAIEAVYRELGWRPEDVYIGIVKDANGNKKKLPTMSMLYTRLEQELNSTHYSDEVRGNLESALKVRIGSLLRREMGDVFDVPESTFAPEKWLQIPAIIELESMGTGPANFLTLMLCSLIREALKADPKGKSASVVSEISDDENFHIKYMFADMKEKCGEFSVNAAELDRLTDKTGGENKSDVVLLSKDSKSRLTLNSKGRYIFNYNDSEIVSKGEFSYNGKNLELIKGSKVVRHVVFIEEAHNLIGPESEEKTGEDADPKRAATAFVVKMLAEVRALKEGIVIADQLPSVMAQEVLKNTGLKIGLKITSEDDRSMLGGTMAASALQLEEMATYKVGHALIFYENLMRPFDLQVNLWLGEMEDEKRDLMSTPKNDDRELCEALKEDPCYAEETARSVLITLKKYYSLFEAAKKNLQKYKDRYNGLLELKDEILKYEKHLYAAEVGEINISEEEKLEENDNKIELVNFYEIQKEDVSKDASLAEILLTGAEQIGTLERLKKGRWRRVSTSETESLLYDFIQGEVDYIDVLLEIYKTATEATEKSEVFLEIKDRMENLDNLNESLKKALQY